MKKNLSIFLFCSFTALLSVNSKAQVKLIHYWDFDKANTPVDGSGGIQLSPYTADYSKIGGAWITYSKVSGTKLDTAIMDNYITTDPLPADSNSQPGYGNCCAGVNYSVRARNPSDSMQFLWYVPTKGYKNIIIKYITELSSTSSGQAAQLYSYSLDSGATWLSTGLSKSFDSTGVKTWHLDSINLSAIAGANNNSKLVFRITFRTHNTGTSGNNRFDNITIQGDTNTSATSIAEVGTNNTSCSLFPNPANTILNIQLSSNQVADMYIYNCIGQVVKSEELKNTITPISISNLPAGIYLCRIMDIQGNLIKTDKIVVTH
jgi:Secretion system C-terminal sorting domain